MAYEDFTVACPLDGAVYHCRFSNISTGIAPRHSDTVDVRFFINGKTCAVALAHPAFNIFRERTGRPLTDADAIQMAGLFLKELLERGERLESACLPVSIDQTLELAQKVRSVAFV